MGAGIEAAAATRQADAIGTPSGIVVSSGTLPALDAPWQSSMSSAVLPASASAAWCAEALLLDSQPPAHAFAIAGATAKQASKNESRMRFMASAM